MRSLRRLLRRAALTCLLALPLSAAMGAPALDLDGFDRLKHTVALPNGMSGGFPLGMQIIGRPFDEATVLRAGHAYQQATDWHLKRPPV